MAHDMLRGRFVWHELMTSDTAAAAAFYKKIVGWRTQAWPEDETYSIFLAGTEPVAGLMLLPEQAKAAGTPPNWLTYIGTANADATSARLIELGGKVLRPAWDIPTVGRVAIVQDPHGAVFGLYTPIQIMPAGATPAPGEFSWHELATDDQAGAFAFYQDLFGWQKTSSMDMGPEMGLYDMFGWDGMPIGGMFRRPANVPPHWLPYAMVPDSKKAAAVIRTLGATIVNGPMEVPGGDWIVAGLDPQGAAFAVHSLKPQARPARTKVAAAASGTKGAAVRTLKTKRAKAARKAPIPAARRRKSTAAKKGKARGRVTPQKASTTPVAARKKTSRPAGRAKSRRSGTRAKTRQGGRKRGSRR